MSFKPVLETYSSLCKLLAVVDGIRKHTGSELLCIKDIMDEKIAAYTYECEDKLLLEDLSTLISHIKVGKTAPIVRTYSSNQESWRDTQGLVKIPDKDLPKEISSGLAGDTKGYYKEWTYAADKGMHYRVMDRITYFVSNLYRPQLGRIFYIEEVNKVVETAT